MTPVTRVVEEFATLDPGVWVPAYLPHWSSRAESAAAWEITGEGLRLHVPVDHPLWCPDTHPSPLLRVSGIASGGWSGPVGSTRGPQPIGPEVVVREAQPTIEGWLPTTGRVAVTCRMTISHRSMAAVWFSGVELEGPDAGEICLFEVFGDAVGPGPSAAVGMGLKALGDPDLVEDFDAPRLDLDVAESHTYAVEWDAREAVFSVDGDHVRTCQGPPTYPMHVMVAVFDFPERSRGEDDHLVPELVVHRIEGEGP